MSVAGAPAQTEYANQPAIDAVDDGTVWHVSCRRSQTLKTFTSTHDHYNR